MPKITVKANELSKLDVEFVSLVKRGANRIPFRFTKGDTSMSIDFSKLFKTDATNEVATQKQDEAIQAAIKQLESAGYKVEKSGCGAPAESEQMPPKKKAPPAAEEAVEEEEVEKTSDPKVTGTNTNKQKNKQTVTGDGVAAATDNDHGPEEISDKPVHGRKDDEKTETAKADASDLASVVKNLGDGLTAQIGELTKAIKGVVERVEKVEEVVKSDNRALRNTVLGAAAGDPDSSNSKVTKTGGGAPPLLDTGFTRNR